MIFFDEVFGVFDDVWDELVDCFDYDYCGYFFFV